MSLIIFGDSRMAEIVIDPAATTEHVLDAMDLVRLLLAHGVTAAKIIRTQTAQESPPPRFGPNRWRAVHIIKEANMAKMTKLKSIDKVVRIYPQAQQVQPG